MKIHFIGAAQTVTGSMHLIEVNDTKILLDCGLFQGKRKESFELNRKLDQFDPAEIDCIILSHAHIDHAGNIPSMIRRGFKGTIYSTFATKDLATVMLLDSAHIQMKDVEYVNKKRSKQGKNLFEPLYDFEDVYETVKHFEAVNYHRQKEIADGIKLRFYDAGHILGSAIVTLTINENGDLFNLTFTGDLGRCNMPILRDPEKTPDPDVLICESTYGNRLHDEFAYTQDRMIEVIKKASDRRSKIIVPSFSVGRTQELVLMIHDIFDQKLAPKIPIYVDSPLSVNATEVFRLHPECFDFETSRYLVENKDPFGFNSLRYIKDVEDSKQLIDVEGPYMVISSSGMVEAGRILHHVKNNCENPDNIILIVGFNAEHTLGRRIVNREPYIKIFGEQCQLNAEVVEFNSLSAHADQQEILDYVNQFDKSRLNNIFLVHGEFDSQDVLRNKMLELGFRNIHIPERGQIFEF